MTQLHQITSTELIVLIQKEPTQIAGVIDHTQLKPQATTTQITQLCAEAIEHHFASVCVNPAHVPLATKLLEGSDIPVCTVVGFPLGANTTNIKVLETQEALDAGAVEIDMVINVGALKSGDDDLVAADIAAVVETTHAGGGLCKVIIETALLTSDEIVRVSQQTRNAGADFVKTSTGFSTAGATVEHIALMRKTVGPEMGIKASAGIRDFETAKMMILAGATRIGASAGVQIVAGAM